MVNYSNDFSFTLIAKGRLLYEADSLYTHNKRVFDGVCVCSSMSQWFAQVVERRTSNTKVLGSTPTCTKHRLKV